MQEHELSWKERLDHLIPASIVDELDLFEHQVELRKQGKIDEKVFAELRLRRGAYGQRYDNGRRYDGVESQELNFPRRGLTKGPETEWDAPGMQRIKIPYGKVSAEQLEALAECAEEYSNGVLHITTRQDVQLHFVDIEDTPDMHRRLAAVGITTREACGNSVRNVTGCPFAGVCDGEAFDVTPYAHAATWFLLGHRDAQDFGRKFKIAFSGCHTDSMGCGRAMMHDLGFIASVRGGVRGFRVVVGGGLGPVPHVARELFDFIPATRILEVSQAISRVYARLGEKRNRNKARIKFLVAKLGIDAFRELVEQELELLEPDPRWTDLLSAAQISDVEHREVAVTDGSARPVAGYRGWVASNVKEQAQPGFMTVLVNLPLGDLTADQARALADIVRRYTRNALRTTVDQNLLIRWIHAQDIVQLHQDLLAVGLALPGATTVADVTSCPGTDTCKLGIASSRGLAATLRSRLEEQGAAFNADVKDVHIRVSGCPNSCGLHHIGDIGFYGASRNVGAYKVPHFQLLLGGALDENAANYGLAVGVVPSKRAPEVVDRLLSDYAGEKRAGESFRDWVARIGKKAIKERLSDLTYVPDHADAPEYYVDWHDAREYSVGDIGIGECAGEVVSLTEFDLATAESRVFEASLLLDDPDGGIAAARLALDAMLLAARGLVKLRNVDVRYSQEEIVAEFEHHFVHTGAFFDRFVGASEWQYLQSALESGGTARDIHEARRRVEEAQLFLEGAYACYTRLLPAGRARRGVGDAENKGVQ